MIPVLVETTVNSAVLAAIIQSAKKQVIVNVRPVLQNLVLMEEHAMGTKILICACARLDSMVITARKHLVTNKTALDTASVK